METPLFASWQTTGIVGSVTARLDFFTADFGSSSEPMTLCGYRQTDSWSAPAATLRAPVPE